MAQATFQEISASDFFYRNRDIAGFTNPSRAIFAAIRELVENSLDAAESLRIPPDIYVRLSFEGEASQDTQIYKDLISEGVLAIEMAALASDVAMTIHPHPTLSETIMEAAEGFFYGSINS